MAKKKRTKKKKREEHKRLVLFSLRSIILILLVVFCGYFLVSKYVLSSNINKKTANYISFRNTTDGTQLFIDELKVLSDKEGKSNHNRSFVEFDVVSDGVEGSSFDVIINPINNKIDLRYIKYSLVDSNNKEVGFGNLYIAEENENGIIIHSGVLNNNKDKYILRLWISNEYKGKDLDGNSYEVKIYLK